MAMLGPCVNNVPSVDADVRVDLALMGDDHFFDDRQPYSSADIASSAPIVVTIEAVKQAWKRILGNVNGPVAKYQLHLSGRSL